MSTTALQPISPPKRPRIKLKGDREHIVYKSGELLAFQIIGPRKNLALWRFGFLPGSVLHNRTGLSQKKFLWVISTYGGGFVKAKFQGLACELPEKFRVVLGRG